MRLCTVSSGVNVLFIPLSDVTISKRKWRQFSISQTVYSNDHVRTFVYASVLYWGQITIDQRM